MFFSIILYVLQYHVSCMSTSADLIGLDPEQLRISTYLYMTLNDDILPSCIYDIVRRLASSFPLWESSSFLISCDTLCFSLLAARFLTHYKVSRSVVNHERYFFTARTVALDGGGDCPGEADEFCSLMFSAAAAARRE